MAALNLLVVSDFNAQNLASLLSKGNGKIQLNATAAPFGQVMQTLLSPSEDLWRADLVGAIVWTSPQGVSNAYARLLANEGATRDELLGDVKAFAAALTRVPAHVKHILVPTWIPLHFLEDRRGLLDMDRDYGVSHALMTMNLALADAVRDDPRVHLFDASRWLAIHGERAYDARLWYLSKTPFSAEMFKEAARDFVAAIRGLLGRARKVIVLDLDGTLWGGIVGDVGWENLRIGGHDAVGEAYRDFQLALKNLSRRGVLLGIASKNEETTALEALRSHPEMALRPDDFAGWRIDWNDKARNIVNLLADLNLGIDAAVFIDDNPAERGRVREALPALLVPEWPKSPLQYCDALHRLDCFDAPYVSDEDRERTAMYVSERRRQQLQSEVRSLDDWLKTLDLTVEVEELADANIERTVQLLNKTNQMNLRTRRMSAAELSRWAAANHLRVFRVKDRFGDYGLVGIASLRIDGATAHVEDFVLSCRVMGRQVENAMLHVLTETARVARASSLQAEIVATAKNAPCRQFFESSGMEKMDGAGKFRWDLRRDYSRPDFIKLIQRSDLRRQTATEDGQRDAV